MYKKLSEEEIKNYCTNKKDEFVISHVGDGEYTANIFGNIYSNFWQAYISAKKITPNICVFMETDYIKENELYICYDFDKNSYESYRYLPIISRLTLEKLDTVFNSGL